LVLRTEDELQRPKDKLALDAYQFSKEILHEHYLIPFCKTTAQLNSMTLHSVNVVGENAGWDKGQENQVVEMDAGYLIVFWPPQFPN